MAETILEEDDRKMLKQTRDLLEEILETIEIVSDKDAMKKFEEAKEDVKKGRVRKFLSTKDSLKPLSSDRG